MQSLLDWFLDNCIDEELVKHILRISPEELEKVGPFPGRRPDYLVDRETYLREIRKKLDVCGVVIMRGSAGVGKSELVREYAEKYERRDKYYAKYYDENVDRVDNYILRVPIHFKDEAKKTKDDIVSERLELIHKTSRKILFVLDNYTGDLDDLKRLYPKKDEAYQLIVIVGDSFEVDRDDICVEIEAFSSKKAYEFLKYYCPRLSDEEIRSLQSYLENNPEAMFRCATFLRNNGSYSPDFFIRKGQSSIKEKLESIKALMLQVDVLKNPRNKMVIECLSLVPYEGMDRSRFVQYMSVAVASANSVDFISSEKDAKIRRVEIEKRAKEIYVPIIEPSIQELCEGGWVSISEQDLIFIKQDLSDVFFTNTRPDMTSKTIVFFVLKILAPISKIRELKWAEVEELRPFVEHLVKRVKESEKCALEILNSIREFYIWDYGDYNGPEFLLVDELLKREFKRFKETDPNAVENAKYRQGIHHFNLKDYERAWEYFDEAISDLDSKILTIEKEIAKICSYEATSLADLACETGDEEMKNLAKNIVLRGIKLRKKLSRSKAQFSEECKVKLWVSYYNYAKVLMRCEEYEKALKMIEKASSIHKEFYPEAHEKCKNLHIGAIKGSENQIEQNLMAEGVFDVSSLFHQKGQILSGLGIHEEAIEWINKARIIREHRKGEKHFTTGQVYSYLMKAYARWGRYEEALEYAKLYYGVLEDQRQTEYMIKLMRKAEDDITEYKEKLKLV